MYIEESIVKKIIYFLFGGLLFNFVNAQAIPISKVEYAILIPMLDESTQLIQDLKHKIYVNIDGIHYIKGSLMGNSVVFANTGLGKTNMSLIAARLIHDFHPHFIFLAGSAGSINPALNKKSIVVGTRVMDADLGTLTAQGAFYPNENYFSTPQKNNSPIPKEYISDSLITKAAQSSLDQMPQNQVIFGAVATSDILPNTTEQTTLLKYNKIDAVEMEGASFMQVCWFFDVSCLVVRGISNNVDEEITEEDTIQAGANAAKFVQYVINYLAQHV